MPKPSRALCQFACSLSLLCHRCFVLPKPSGRDTTTVLPRALLTQLPRKPRSPHQRCLDYSWQQSRYLQSSTMNNARYAADFASRHRVGDLHQQPNENDRGHELQQSCIRRLDHRLWQERASVASDPATWWKRGVASDCRQHLSRLAVHELGHRRWRWVFLQSVASRQFRPHQRATTTPTASSMPPITSHGATPAARPALPPAPAPTATAAARSTPAITTTGAPLRQRRRQRFTRSHRLRHPRTDRCNSADRRNRSALPSSPRALNSVAAPQSVPNSRRSMPSDTFQSRRWHTLRHASLSLYVVGKSYQIPSKTTLSAHC